MATPPLLDIEALLAPIPGDNPAGDSVPFAIREKLEEGRKEVNPDLYPEDDPRRPEGKSADWSGIVRLAENTLTETSKDLQTAARMTEALTKLHGFAGARDGFRLLRRLLEECWDRLNPSIEDGDLDVRAAPFNWIDDPDRGARFPNTLRTAPLVSADGADYGWQHWRQSKDGRGQVPAEAFERAVAGTPRSFCQTVMEDLTQSLNELDLLRECLTARLEGEASDLLEIRNALEDSQVLAQQILERKGPAPATAPEAPPEETGEAAPGDEARPAPSRRATTREEVYAQLMQAAATLQQLEPHSPIPYLIQRAVELGALPFPQLMRALIRDDNVLMEMNRELGIKETRPHDAESE